MNDAAGPKRPSITPGDMVRLTAYVRLRDTAGGEVDLTPDTPLMYLGMNRPPNAGGSTYALVMGRDRIMEVHPARLRRVG